MSSAVDRGLVEVEEAGYVDGNGVTWSPTPVVEDGTVHESGNRRENIIQSNCSNHRRCENCHKRCPQNVDGYGSLTAYGNNFASRKEAFLLFLDKDIISDNVKYTNERGMREAEKYAYCVSYLDGFGNNYDETLTTNYDVNVGNAICQRLISILGFSEFRIRINKVRKKLAAKNHIAPQRRHQQIVSNEAVGIESTSTDYINEQNHDQTNLNNEIVDEPGIFNEMLTADEIRELRTVFLRLSKWKCFTFTEVCAIFGVCLFLGVSHQRRTDLKFAFSSRGNRIMSNSVVGIATSRDRFNSYVKYFALTPNNFTNVDYSEHLRNQQSITNAAQENNTPQHNNRHTENVQYVEHLRGSKVIPIMNQMVRNFNRAYIPTKTLTVDEQMISFHGQTKMKQIIKGKPKPVGLKVFTLGDENSFTVNMQLYTGKKTHNNEMQENVTSYGSQPNVHGKRRKMNGEVGLGKRVVLDMISTLNDIVEVEEATTLLTERTNATEHERETKRVVRRIADVNNQVSLLVQNEQPLVNTVPNDDTPFVTVPATFDVTTDRFFTSYDLAAALNEKNISLLGTLRADKREIPNSLRKTTRSKQRVLRRVGSSVYAFRENITILSFCSKKQKLVHLLSSRHARPHFNPTVKKPQMIYDYNKTKGYVDNINQMLEAYSCQRTTRKWHVSCFQRLLDICALNAYVIWNLKYCNGSKYNVSQQENQSQQTGPQSSSNLNTRNNGGTKLFSRSRRNRLESRSVFLISLAMEMISPFASERYYGSHALSRDRRRDIEKFLGIEPSEEVVSASNNIVGIKAKRRRCEKCPTRTNNKTRYACIKCLRYCCRKHCTVKYSATCCDCQRYRNTQVRSVDSETDESNLSYFSSNSSSSISSRDSTYSRTSSNIITTESSDENEDFE